MDRTGANLEECIANIEDRLSCRVLLLQHLEMKEEEIVSIVDLVEMKRIRYLDELGNSISIEDVTSTDPDYENIKKKRDELLESLADFDEQIMEAVLEGHDLPSDLIKKTIRKVLLEHPKDYVAAVAGR